MAKTIEAFICEAVRTPRGKGRTGGTLATVKPVRLLVLADLMAEAARRSDLDTARIDDIVIGCVSPTAEQGGPIDRTASLLLGWSDNTSGLQLNRFCGSGLEAIGLAAQKVRSGWEHLVIAGGVESMSRVPMFSDGGAWQFDPEISLATTYVPQGISADLIATLGGWDRSALDAFAARSHRLADEAWADGRFEHGVVAVRDEMGQMLLDRDENIRAGTTVETLSGLVPAFAETGRNGCDFTALAKYGDVAFIDHNHTAGNSSAMADGAAVAITVSESMIESTALTPRAHILSTAVHGSEPAIMLTGPAIASRKALALAGLVSTTSTCSRPTRLSRPSRCASWPIRAFRWKRSMLTGARLPWGTHSEQPARCWLGTLIDELYRTGDRYGLVTMCIGAGMGIATIKERV